MNSFIEGGGKEKPVKQLLRWKAMAFFFLSIVFAGGAWSAYDYFGWLGCFPGALTLLCWLACLVWEKPTLQEWPAEFKQSDPRKLYSNPDNLP